MRFICVVLVLGFLAFPASAQTIDSYELAFYNAGAASPISAYPFVATTVACGLTASPPGASAVNPTRINWDDPDLPGLVCEHVFVAGSALFALPIPGSYEGVLVAINEVDPSPESNRAPFDTLAAPGVQSGLRFVR